MLQLAVDGKVLRGRSRQDGQPLQLLSAVTHHLRLTLDPVPIAEKSNGIPALAPLLKKINPPSGVLITADAKHCQQESARFIAQELGGDYLFDLKGYQSGILDQALRLPAQQAFPPDEAVAWGKGHHRLDRRRISRVAVSPEEIGLCGCWEVIAVQRKSIGPGQPDAQPTVGVGYYTSSLSLEQRDEAAVAAPIRGRWSGPFVTSRKPT